MDEHAEKMLPRFRYGVIHPRSSGGIQRGPGYQLYRLVPLDVMEISTGLGLENYTREGVEKTIGNYWSCVELLAREKVDVIVIGGAPVSAQLGRPRVLDLHRQTKEKTGAPVDAAGISLEEGLGTALDVGREAAKLAPRADAIGVPGGAAMSLHVIPALEAEFGKPAFANMSVEVWNNLVPPPASSRRCKDGVACSQTVAGRNLFLKPLTPEP